MTANSEIVVGVVGANGDLGRQVATMAAEHGFEVLKTDIKRIVGGTSLQSVMDSSDFVHFCIPEHGFEDEYVLRPGQSGILSDSVMATSEKVNSMHFGEQADIAHMLMNGTSSERGSVVIEKNSPNLNQVKSHMTVLGLQAIEMKAPEHDKLSASGQGWQALGVLTQLPILKAGHEKGLLTPSAHAALEGLLDRSAKWTPDTLDSILKNPELPKMLREMLELLENRGNT